MHHVKPASFHLTAGRISFHYTIKDNFLSQIMIFKRISEGRIYIMQGQMLSIFPIDFKHKHGGYSEMEHIRYYIDIHIRAL